MSFSVQIGLLLSLACAFASVLGFLYKHRGAVESAEVTWEQPIRSSLALFSNRWYTLGIFVATVGWGFHAAALALAPISLVQSVIAGGLVMLTVTADRLFAHSVTRREWIGVGLPAAGLAVLAATLEGAGKEAHSDFDPPALLVWIILTCLAAATAGRVADRTDHTGVLLGASAGLIWAASDTAIKAASSNLDDGILAVLIHPLVPFIIAASIVGLTVSARSLQLGKAVPVIAITSVAANAATIASGPIVFDEPLPEDPLGFSLRILAFGLVIFAAALTPAPVRAADELDIDHIEQ